MYLFDHSAEKGVIVDNLLHIKEFIPEAMELDARVGLETCYHVVKYLNQFKLNLELTDKTEILYKNIEDFWHKLCKRQVIPEESIISAYTKQVCDVIDTAIPLLSGDIPPFIQPGDEEWDTILEDSRCVYEVDTKSVSPFWHIQNKYLLIDICFISNDAIILPLGMNYHFDAFPIQFIDKNIQQILYIMQNECRKFYLLVPKEDAEYVKTKCRVPEHLIKNIMGAYYIKVYDMHEELPKFDESRYVLFKVDYRGPLLGYCWDRECDTVDNQYLIAKSGIQGIYDCTSEEVTNMFT